ADLGVAQGQFHGARGFVGRAEHDAVIGFASRAITGDFGPDFGAARDGVFAFFDDNEPRAFAKHEAVAGAVEWARGALGRVVVFGGHGAHQAKAGHDAGRDGSVG